MKLNEELTMQEAIDQLYLRAELTDDGGIDLPYVELPLFAGFSIYFPNNQARKEVLHKHDMHHELTGYRTNWNGETEISAWEIATGCRHNYMALLLNYGGMVVGMTHNLPNVWKAYMRGKETRNLYQVNLTMDELRNMKVDDLRKELGLDRDINPRNKFWRGLQFAANGIGGLLLAPIALLTIPFTLLYTLYVYATK